MATSTTRPQKAYFSTVSRFPSARCSREVTISSSRRCFRRSQVKIWRMNKIMNGTGTRLPAMAAHMDVLSRSPRATPSGMAKRSSSTGIMAEKNVSSIL